MKVIKIFSFNTTVHPFGAMRFNKIWPLLYLSQQWHLGRLSMETAKLRRTLRSSQLRRFTQVVSTCLVLMLKYF